MMREWTRQRYDSRGATRRRFRPHACGAWPLATAGRPRGPRS